MLEYSYQKWVALVCLLLMSALAMADDKPVFNIPPQSLSSALLDFSYQSNVQLIIPGHIVEGFYSDGLSGVYEPEQALKILIKDTGLKYEFVSDFTVTIQAENTSKLAVAKRRPRLKKRSYYGLEQILVTAEGRVQEAQRLAVALTAISGEDLEKRGITNADELQVFVPGLTIDSAQSGATDFTIRGIGASNDDLTTDPGVVVYIDDVYIPRQGPANLAVYDLDRVEVVRGPQGISSGRNTPGGAIKYVTRKPTADFEARYLADIGNLGRINNTLTINGALSQTLYGQFAFATFKRDSIMQNAGSNAEEGNDIDNISGRISLRALPKESLELLFTADTQTVDQGEVLYSLGPNDGYRLHQSIPPVDRSVPVRSAATSFVGGEEIHISGLMARANLSNEAFKTSYIFGYREHDLDGRYDLDQQVADLIREGLYEASQMKTLEVRLVSDQSGTLSMDGRLDWTVGAFFLNEKGYAEKTYNTVGLGFGNNLWEQTVVNRSAALYAQMGYAFTAKASLALGVRASTDTKDFKLKAVTDAPSSDNALLTESFHYHNKEHWHKASPRFALSYSASENTLYYGSFTRGYKPGGFEGTPINYAAAASGQFSHEDSENYELGMKSKLFNNRVKFNLMSFVTHYDNFQVSGFEYLGNPIIVNADNVDIRGIELELEARPIRSLHIGLGVSFLDTEFKNFLLTSREGVQENRAGQPIPDAPDTTVNLSAIYTFNETQHGVYSIRADAIYSDQALDEDLNVSWPSYRVFNLWFDYVPLGGRWELGFWVRNLTDELYYRGSLAGVTSNINAMARKLEPPRQFGTSFKYFW